MKRNRAAHCGLLVLAIGSWLVSTPGAAAQSRVDSLVQAGSVLLWDEGAKSALFRRQIYASHPPASTTKLMTALLVYQKTHLAGEVVISQQDLSAPGEVPTVRLLPGDRFTVADLVRALLISSSNEAALALARHVSGSVDAFVTEMNARAKELGCEKTHFVNPNGITAPGHLTCASDLLRIFEAAIAVEPLRTICSTESFSLFTTEGKAVQYLMNTNRLLGPYPGVGPAKTGWTRESRHTYAALCQRGERRVALILLDSPNKWSDAVALFDYAFGGQWSGGGAGP
ncbi:serine-type D-Ala-D-Ala carboxypeptidase (penicillin-binding protein 5/6) [Methylacidimicrobium cyclopophantes]|uniref:Serine-type D-Ala-D-Ala carboxypeptidase (Penicillin-binding protein 5/6) n=1 Tax=Methylacidimicrobium cyclopophantes TaxID=1041766 RepID=A0A5E6M763_9BACT|nr:serine hydrolase [Methylacidimicrobium cyclopophantes]VVM04771.1 serine-type D-Ala-D-Ala carboxypeptidase (penicillin-binding protein 5/6) [Methylacidimicrobium cyclopophantes]